MFKTAWSLVSIVCIAAGVLCGQSAPQDSRRHVIITFRQPPAEGEEASVRLLGGTVKHRLQIVPALAALLPDSAVASLRGNPAVARIDDDAPIHTEDEYTSSWGVSRIGAKIVHDSGNMGGNLKVCILDSGIDYTHPELAPNYIGGYDFINGDADPKDDFGHGTYVAGVLAAIRNGLNTVGASPQVQILAYKIVDSAGNGYISDAVAAIQYCQAAGGKITNNSYATYSDPGPTVQQAFDNSYAAGMLHVAAAGNAGSGADTVGYPARYNSVIAVAATDQTNTRASWSSTGPSMELSAPGVQVLTTAPNNSYIYANGTSFGSAHVSGVAALVFNCGITTNTAVRARLQQTAQDLGTAGRDNLYGYGLVRADLAAMNCLSSPPPSTGPSNPNPADGATQISTSASLSWTGVTGATGYDVYFGTASNPPYVGGTYATTYNPGTLAASTKYYWRIASWNSTGPMSASPVWSFTTAASSTGTPPPPPSTLGPVSVTPSSGTGISQTFSFTFSAPNGLANANVLINASVSATSACWFNYNPSSNTLALADDTATTWMFATRGSATSLQNSQCMFAANAVTVSQSGATTVLTVPLNFKTFQGLKNVYMRVQDNTGTITQFSALGTWKPY